MFARNNSNKLKKLIIYCSCPFFDTWPKKLKLDEFKNYGFDVELWSTEEIFFKLENIKLASSGSENYLYKDLNIIKIKSLFDLDKKVLFREIPDLPNLENGRRPERKFLNTCPSGTAFVA